MPVLVTVAWLVLSVRTFLKRACVFSGVSLVAVWLWHLPQVKNRMLLFTPVFPLSLLFSPSCLLKIPAASRLKSWSRYLSSLSKLKVEVSLLKSHLISFFPFLWLYLSSSPILHSAFSLHFSTSQWWRVCLMKWLMGVYYRETEWSGRLL